MALLLWACVVVIASGAVRNIRLRKEIESLPGIVWLLLMAVPFLYQLPEFAEPYRSVQALGISVIGFAIVAGDYWSGSRHQLDEREITEVAVFGDARLYGLLFFVFAAYHLSLLDNIPVIEKLFGSNQSDRALQWMREETSKLLPVTDLLKYVFTWNVNIFAPVAILLLLAKRKYVWAAVVMAAAVGYSIMSLAKVPVFLLLLILLVALLRSSSLRVRYRIYLAGTLVVIPVAWHASNFLVHHPLSVLNYKAETEVIARLEFAEDDPRADLTMGDHTRLRPREEHDALTFAEKRYNYFVYRLFLGPSDVSSRWYQYFPKESGGFIGLSGLTNETRKVAGMHPARRVGKWAYTDRFPDRYLQTAQAYASVDADAYGRFGIPGIFVAGILVLGIRILLRWLLNASPVSQAAYSVGLVLYALLWPMASVQAVFVSNGLLLVLVLMAVVKFATGFKRANRDQGKLRGQAPG
jgi:hypothetical protein